MTQIDDDQLRSKVLMRRLTHKEDAPQSLMQIRGDFLMIAQGDQIVLLTKKEAFAKQQIFNEFVKGEK